MSIRFGAAPAELANCLSDDICAVYDFKDVWVQVCTVCLPILRCRRRGCHAAPTAASRIPKSGSRKGTAIIRTSTATRGRAMLPRLRARRYSTAGRGLMPTKLLKNIQAWRTGTR